VLVVDVAALAPRDDWDLVVVVVGPHTGEVHPEMLPGLLLERAGSSLGGLEDGLGRGCHLLSLLTFEGD
jgi:hypothetical protein